MLSISDLASIFGEYLNGEEGAEWGKKLGNIGTGMLGSYYDIPVGADHIKEKRILTADHTKEKRILSGQCSVLCKHIKCRSSQCICRYAI